MRIDLLASGSKGNACVVRDGTTCILIDCGTTKKYLTEAMRKVDLQHDDIDAVLITHDHSDHIAQLGMFKDLPVYSPVELPDIERFHVEPMKPFFVETLKVTPLALSHDAPHTTGYILENGMEKLVYITDTGYVRDTYYPLCKGADYIVLECNHDVEMLMHTRRPQYIKARIFSDEGHLCNEDCADVLDHIVTTNTKSVFLAHISQEADTRELALQVVCEKLRNHRDVSKKLVVAAAGQFEILTKGERDEEMDYGSVSCTPCLECGIDHQDLFSA